MKKILFVGLGRMGHPMAARLVGNPDVELYVYNRSASKLNHWTAKYHERVHAQGQQYDAIILCLGDDESVRNTLLGPLDLLNCVTPGGLIIDHTTTSAELAKSLYETCLDKNVHFYDAPVSGGEQGAINGTLTSMVGGDGVRFGEVAEIIQPYCKSVSYVGTAGAGQITKMANQMCIAGTLAGIAEAVKLLDGETSINPHKSFNAIRGGAAQSWQLDNRIDSILADDFDFGFAIKHMIKDLGYAIGHAESQEWEPTIAKIVKDFYENLAENGHGSADTSVLAKYYKLLKR